MATVFGIEESEARGFIDKGIFCVPLSAMHGSVLHATVAPVKNEDIVFIKHCTPSGLNINAVGFVRSDFPVVQADRVCMPIEWVWRGNKTIVDFEEAQTLHNEVLYEEHDILVQREIIDLLPKNFQMAQEW